MGTTQIFVGDDGSRGQAAFGDGDDNVDGVGDFLGQRLTVGLDVLPGESKFLSHRLL